MDNISFEEEVNELQGFVYNYWESDIEYTGFHYYDDKGTILYVSEGGKYGFSRKEEGWGKSLNDYEK